AICSSEAGENLVWQNRRYACSTFSNIVACSLPQGKPGVGKTRCQFMFPPRGEVLSKVVDGRSEKGGVPLVKFDQHQTCRRGKGVRHREPVYIRDRRRANAQEP